MPKRMKGIPEVVPIHEVYEAFRAGYYAGIDQQFSRAQNEESYLNVKRAAYLKKRFNHDVPK